ncbi:hypothetical protein [Paenibacillus sp. P32E]|uniref:hypothetical protein n=1 Tax=Paenibacillus sp. P32E TaxID=1349434 RepID=UPI00093B1F91|nr:hypothetical protein [Paenibacillus sp. P32E]OKP94788.1 hypothetical protein A3848_02105 [Paenibacillus sp. P32E]
MDPKLIERDLREEIAFWLQVQQDAHWRGGEVDLKIAEYAAKQQRRLQDDLLNLWDGESRKAFEQAALTFANEKQPTGVGAGELITIQTNFITNIVARNGGICNGYVS